MNRLKNLKIKDKLVTCFAILAIVTAIVGLFGIVSIYSIQNKSEEMYYNHLVPATKLSDVQVELQNIRANQILALYEQNTGTVSGRIAAIDESVAKDDQLLAEYESTIDEDENQALFDDLTEKLSDYRQVRNDNLALIEAGNYDQALVVLSEVTAAREATDDSLQALIDYNDAYAQTLLADNADYFRNMAILMIVISIAGIVLAVGLGLKLANSIANPLKSMVHAAQQIAEGDLDVTVSVEANDEVGDLGKAFERMSQNLNEVLGNIDSAAVQVTVGAKQVADSSMALSQGATEQASSVEELSSAIEEIAAQTIANAQNADTANNLAEQTRSNAVEGNSKMQLMLKSMEEINVSSANISKIIKVIDEIAFQTNILALNAAVEAARARQHGKGFAVVAEEVRNLAARSADAAKETTALIEGSIKKVEHGTQIATQTADDLNQIVEDITQVTDIVGEIAAASNEQSIGISQINTGLSQVSDVVQMNSATSEESAAASEELSGQADLMREQVSQFKLKGRRGGAPRSGSHIEKDKGSDIYLNDVDFGKY
ncbi:methyl-accepting chemotaxis protein [Eubacteriaceae bacterium ES2]|nr:methyl-accepting chemotaxis protein [Eubacteriaceae bacterium ES2]